MGKREISVYGKKYDVNSLRRGQACLAVDGDSMLCKVDGKYFEVENVEDPYHEPKVAPLTVEEAEKWVEYPLFTADQFVKEFGHESERLRESEREEAKFVQELKEQGISVKPLSRYD